MIETDIVNKDKRGKPKECIVCLTKGCFVKIDGIYTCTVCGSELRGVDDEE